MFSTLFSGDTPRPLTTHTQAASSMIHKQVTVNIFNVLFRWWVMLNTVKLYGQHLNSCQDYGCVGMRSSGLCRSRTQMFHFWPQYSAVNTNWEEEMVRIPVLRPYFPTYSLINSQNQKVVWVIIKGGMLKDESLRRNYSLKKKYI